MESAGDASQVRKSIRNEGPGMRLPLLLRLLDISSIVVAG
jgi:hypothetical protein